jgi:uncharacterized protein (TIGR02246 family)
MERRPGSRVLTIMKRQIAIALLLITIAVPSFAQQTNDPAIDAAGRKQIVEIVAHLLDTMYVIPDAGRSVAARIRAAEARGAYDSAVKASALAEALQRDLASANDRHLSLRFNPDMAGTPPLTIAAWDAMAGTPRVRQRAEDPAELRRANYGFRRVEHLDGNIGYIDLGGFMGGDEARAVATASMAFLAGSDAVIVDVRRCPGGSVDAVNYLSSYFFGPERRVLMTRFNRASGETTESTTVDVVGRRMPDVDLYVLTSATTGSACESFPFTLQQYGRAKVVGEKTAGAGYNNAIVPIGYGLAFSVSIGTATHPGTGKSWEAVGVQPDIAVPADRALDAARAAALRKMIANGTAGDRRTRELSVLLQVAEGSSAPDAVAQVRQLEREWLDAYEKRDGAAMQRIVADDFTIVYPGGTRQNKAEVLAALERSRASGSPAPHFNTEDVQARASGDTVVLTGRVITRRTGADGTESRQESHYTDTYVRRDGRWQVAASILTAREP